MIQGWGRGGERRTRLFSFSATMTHRKGDSRQRLGVEGGVRGMDAPLQGSLLPAALLFTHCELSCGGLGFGPLCPRQWGFGKSWFLREFSPDPLPKNKPPC